MPVEELAPVLDLKPLSYNPFTDGTVVYDHVGGAIVPRSSAGMVDPVGQNPLLQHRPSNASTQSLIDSAQRLGPSGVKANAAALRGIKRQVIFLILARLVGRWIRSLMLS